MKKWMTVFLVLGIGLLSGCGGEMPEDTAIAEECFINPAEEATGSGTVTVSAEGEVRIAPDMAEVTLGVENTEADAAEAQRKNSEGVEALLRVLAGLGISEQSIQTTDYSMYPRYDDWGEEITGYRIVTDLTISDLTISELPEVLDACSESGVTEVNRVRYFCSSYDEAYEEAIAEAVKRAREKAAVLAEAAGRSLGEIAEMTEGYEDTSLRYREDNGAFMMATEEEMDAGSGKAWMPGEVSVTAQVTVNYTLY